VSATACNVSNDLWDFNVALCQDHDFRANAFGEFELFRIDVYGNDASADSCRHHHRGKADAPTTVDDQPFAGRHMTLIYDCSKGRCEAATQPCGRGEIDRLGNSNEIYISEVDGDELSERAPSSEPWLKLGAADLLLTSSAFLAYSAARSERHRHAFAHAPPAHATSDSRDRSRKLMPRNMGKPNVGIMSHPTVPVTAAQSRCLHFDDHAGRRRLRVGERC